MKFSGRSFLALCILILSGYGQLYEHAYGASIHDSSSKLSQTLEQASFGTGQGRLPSFNRFDASDRDNIFILDATEVTEEEHKLLSSKKRRASSGYFVAIFCGLTRDHFLSYIQQILFFCKHFQDISSYRRHLIFQVFRI